jgi:inhibitor of KinA
MDVRVSRSFFGVTQPAWVRQAEWRAPSDKSPQCATVWPLSGLPCRQSAAASALKQSRVLYNSREMRTLTTNDAQFQPASDQSLLLYFGQQITIGAHQRVRQLLRLLEQEPIAGVRNLNPAYCSILISFNALRLNHGTLQEILGSYLDRLDAMQIPEGRELQIPVCYGPEFGPDLNEVASLHGMTPDRVIELHASVTYVVYFLGFLPGFAYLGELPEALATPRLDSPRRSTPPGSVGIAGNQTGVYPFAAPGGWRLIGRTPIAMFRPDREAMSFLSIGDRVRFTPISAARFAAMENA